MAEPARTARRDDCHQLLWDALRIGNIGDYEPGHVRQRRDGLGDVPAGRLVEIEEDWQVVPLAEFISDGVENGFTLRTESAKNQDDFRCDRVDDVADFSDC